LDRSRRTAPSDRAEPAGASRLPGLCSPEARRNPWLLAIPATLVLTAWHRFHFIGLALFDDALWQMLAKFPTEPLFARWSVRAMFVMLTWAAEVLTPGRSWAILLLGAVKTYLLIAVSTAILAPEIGVGLASACATAAALTSLWQIEYTVSWPDSSMVAASLLCVYLLHSGPESQGRYRGAGAALTTAMYIKEQAIPTVVVALWATRGRLRPLRDLVLGAAGALAVLTVVMTWRRGVFWWDFLPHVGFFMLVAGETPLRTGKTGLLDSLGYLRGLIDGSAGLVTRGEGLTFPLLYGGLILAVLLSVALRCWRTAAGRSLVLWSAGMTAWICAAVAASGFYEWRYWLAPRVGIVLCGTAGVCLVAARLIRARRVATAISATAVGLATVIVGWNGFAIHRDYRTLVLWLGNVERRVADIVDATPTRAPVVLGIDTLDPERNVVRGWTPERIRMRLIALSQTIPPRPLIMTPPGSGAPPDAVIVSNVKPPQTPGMVTFRIYQKGGSALRTLYVTLPDRLKSAVDWSGAGTPSRDYWRGPARMPPDIRAQERARRRHVDTDATRP
jgi:hypothetical protein